MRNIAMILACGLLLAAPARAQERPSRDHPPLPSAYRDPSEITPAPSTLTHAIVDSLRLLMIEHSIRLLSEPTRQELDGPFLRDYLRSIKIPDTWEDGDSWLVNYLGHPLHGAAAGFIWLDHEDGAYDPQIGFSGEYWSSRSRAMAWAAGYSLQFEFGLLSEASIGNVGMRPGTSGWVDHVVTPVGALGIMVAEDTLDRYFITRVESWTSNRFFRASIRMLFNPSRTFSNLAQARAPWFRVGRAIGER